MKAQYIIEAIDAMKAADAISYMMKPEEMAEILHKLGQARINLLVESGIGHIDIPVERDGEGRTA